MWNKFCGLNVFWLIVWFLTSENVLKNCTAWHRRHQFPFLNENHGRAVDEKKSDTGAQYRLPSGITRPLRYDLNITPTLGDTFDFKGGIIIRIIVEKRTNKIHLHCHRLEIKWIKLAKGNRVLPASFEVDAKNQMLIVTTKNDLVFRGEYELELEFSGILNEEMIGFYRSSYLVSGKKKWLAVTQFEATNARMAFPCYDEPEYRATFSIHIARQSHQKSISNMPLKLTSKPDSTVGGLVWDIFEDTPEMPTYLVAFIVGELTHMTDAVNTFSVWARENALDDTRYVLEAGPKLLHKMADLVNVPYNLPKMDMVAIPDFQNGGMENWGLITYR